MMKIIIAVYAKTPDIRKSVSHSLLPVNLHALTDQQAQQITPNALTDRLVTKASNVCCM